MAQGWGQKSFRRGLTAKVLLWASPLVLLLAGQTSWSQVETGQIAELVSVTGASNWVGNGYNSNPAIYGGVAGTIPSPATAQCPQDGVTACNNCTGNTACNANRIYPSEQVTISAEILGGITQGSYNYAFLVAEGTDGATYAAINASGQGQPVYSQGQEVTFTTTWMDLCTAFGDQNSGSTDCNPANSTTFSIYLVLQNTTTFSGQLSGEYQLIQLYILGPADTNPMGPCITGTSSTSDEWGICNFYANAGDSEVYVENPAENIACPGNSGATGISGVRVFYVPDDGTQNFTTITYASPHQDFQVDGSCNPVGDWTVTGLTNGQGYFFLTSVLDAADNNSLLLDNTSTSLIFTPNGGPCEYDVSYTGNTADIDSCLLYSVPGKVIGLLPGGVSCFIATAAYGSPFEPIVKTLRTWRDEFLLPYHYGRAFVRFYYRHSPYLAVRIRKSPVLKHITQVALLPLGGVAWLMITYGGIGTLLIILSGIFLIGYLMRDSRT